MGGHSPSRESGSADAPTTTRSKVTKVRGEGGILDYIKKGGVVGAIGRKLEETAGNLLIAELRKYVLKIIDYDLASVYRTFTEETKYINEAEDDEKRRMLNRKGRRSTILTGTGLTEIEDENIDQKTLLGGD